MSKEFNYNTLAKESFFAKKITVYKYPPTDSDRFVSRWRIILPDGSIKYILNQKGDRWAKSCYAFSAYRGRNVDGMQKYDALNEFYPTRVRVLIFKTLVFQLKQLSKWIKKDFKNA